MKEIKAIIKPHMAERVLTALHELPHFPGLTILRAHGQGRGHGPHGEYKLSMEEVFEHEVAMIEVVCADEMSGPIVEAIRQAAHTGRHGDGIIIISDINSVVRIGTGEAQDKAV